jgi:pyruvate dehydrogenase E1 component
MTDKFIDQDPQETQEWLEALEAVVEFEGSDKAQHLINALIAKARQFGIDTPYSANTPYINTIPPEQQPKYPGDLKLERRLRAILRWNAMAMVVRANKYTGVGGHIASYASSCTLYEVGFNHFFRGPDAEQGHDFVYFQGHTAPGMYARAYLEGRLDEEHLKNFRQEVDGHGLSSYPHPWLMPNFWQYPTVSMGLGPIMAIYQARFMKYMQARGLAKTDQRKVWAFLGDGEMDEPESRGAIHLASREKLNNLIFVVNCNLQRLDGPVRGNGKIIQELEAFFRGAGWNVIKVIWGTGWDQLLAKDTSGKLIQRMGEVVDGEYQAYKAKDGAYVREHFFGKYPETAKLVEDWTDDEIFRLTRGGHSPRKIYAAYKAATESDLPTVILAKTVKGYGMGPYGEAANTTHQQKKLDIDGLKYFRDRFAIPISDEDLEKDVPFYRPPEDSDIMQYLHKRRKELGGYLPSRSSECDTLPAPKLEAFKALLEGTGEREISTTMAFVRILSTLLRDKQLKDRIVPIIPDEARTFGMEGLFRQIGIYDPAGQLYEPVDIDQVSYYKESEKGQVLEEGINEAGAMSDWIAAATAYSNYGISMIPFYIFYSMFGFQRIGDLVWAAGDLRSRGFLIGATAGRTTLEGEGLQHDDGHNLLFYDAVPNCVSYDPTFAYEMAVIIRDGIKRMYEDKEDVFYYITAMNENYTHPVMPEGAEQGILKGLYLFKAADAKKGQPQVNLLGSGTIFRESIAAADLLRDDWGVAANLWSAPSFNLLARDGKEVARWNMLHPDAEPKQPYVTEQLSRAEGPYVAATDYIRDLPEKIRAYVPGTYITLGTDGFGRSDTRQKLRRHFEVNRYYITVAALKALADDGVIERKVVKDAIEKYGIDADKTYPLYL